MRKLWEQIKERLVKFWYEDIKSLFYISFHLNKSGMSLSLQLLEQSLSFDFVFPYYGNEDGGYSIGDGSLWSMNDLRITKDKVLEFSIYKKFNFDCLLLLGSSIHQMYSGQTFTVIIFGYGFTISLTDLRLWNSKTRRLEYTEESEEFEDDGED